MHLDFAHVERLFALDALVFAISMGLYDKEERERRGGGGHGERVAIYHINNSTAGRKPTLKYKIRTPTSLITYTWPSNQSLALPLSLPVVLGRYEGKCRLLFANVLPSPRRLPLSPKREEAVLLKGEPAVTTAPSSAVDMERSGDEAECERLLPKPRCEEAQVAFMAARFRPRRALSRREGRFRRRALSTLPLSRCCAGCTGIL
jgi:hypothetical protein